MKRHVVLASMLIAVLAIGSVAAPRWAQPKWELLGQKNVSDRVDHDLIAVTRAKGDFKGIKLEVKRRAVDFHRVVIHFANGADQVVELRNTIPAGGESRLIDVNGGDRIIRSIEFWYDAKSLGRGERAAVRVLGHR